MSYLTIGSGDTPALLSGKQTKGYADLWRKFLSENPPHYNSFASPIDALRTGAILEEVYLRMTDESCLYQVKFTGALDVFVSSVDFAYYKSGKLDLIEELKTIWMTDFIDVIRPINDLAETQQIEAIKKAFKNNYNQLQFQLNCTGLEFGHLVFLAVKSYDDTENRLRVIEPNEIIKFRIPRDEKVISLINERGQIFQQVKDNFK